MAEKASISNNDSSAPKRNLEMPNYFHVLSYIEFGFVVLVAICIVFLAIHLACWVCFGWFDEVHKRVILVIKGIDTYWRADLMIIIPLFFRPIFKFLIHLREGPLGTKSGEPLSPQNQTSAQTYQTEASN